MLFKNKLLIKLCIASLFFHTELKGGKVTLMVCGPYTFRFDEYILGIVLCFLTEINGTRWTYKLCFEKLNGLRTVIINEIDTVSLIIFGAERELPGM